MGDGRSIGKRRGECFVPHANLLHRSIVPDRLPSTCYFGISLGNASSITPLQIACTVNKLHHLTTANHLRCVDVEFRSHFTSVTPIDSTSPTLLASRLAL